MDVPESGTAGAAVPNLAEGFPAATREQWRELVAGVLRKSGVAEDRLAETPESVLATHAYDGFDIELVREIAERLELELVIRDTPFDTIFRDLAQGKFDAVVAARVASGIVDAPLLVARYALWDRTPEAPVVIGLRTDRREVLVTDVMPRLPRFLGKSTLWRNPLLARILDSAGALPVYRPAEDSAARNEEMFQACYRALVEGDVVTEDRVARADLEQCVAQCALSFRRRAGSSRWSCAARLRAWSWAPSAGPCGRARCPAAAASDRRSAASCARSSTSTW